MTSSSGALCEQQPDRKGGLGPLAQGSWYPSRTWSGTVANLSVHAALETETDDEEWSYIDVHDLWRSWGGYLLWDCGLSPMAVMEFGGWSDWSTFEEHYMRETTPQAMDRERAKTSYLGGEPADEDVLFEPDSPAPASTYGRAE